MKKPKAFRILLSCGVLLTPLAATNAAVFNIPNGDVAALKNAIKTANNNKQPDTINLAANGAYLLQSVDNPANGPTGLPPIGDDVAGLDLKINGNGATIRRSPFSGAAE